MSLKEWVVGAFEPCSAAAARHAHRWLRRSAALPGEWVTILDPATHEARGNHERAAEARGMSRRTMDDHIARLGLTELQSALWPRSVRQPQRRGQRG